MPLTVGLNGANIVERLLFAAPPFDNIGEGSREGRQTKLGKIDTPALKSTSACPKAIPSYVIDITLFRRARLRALPFFFRVLRTLPLDSFIPDLEGVESATSILWWGQLVISPLWAQELSLSIY
jgi:hypothetical protein